MHVRTAMRQKGTPQIHEKGCVTHGIGRGRSPGQFHAERKLSDSRHRHNSLLKHLLTQHQRVQTPSKRSTCDYEFRATTAQLTSLTIRKMLPPQQWFENIQGTTPSMVLSRSRAPSTEATSNGRSTRASASASTLTSGTRDSRAYPTRAAAVTQPRAC